MRKGIALILVGVVMGVGCSSSPAVDIEANKTLVRGFTDAVNAGEWDALSGIMAEDFIRHSTATQGPPVASREAFVQMQKTFLSSFPDQHMELGHVVAEGEFVSVTGVYSGTQMGPMGDFHATGKAVQSPFLSLLRIEEGKIVEMWVEWDNLAILTQLDHFPPQPAAQGD